MYPVRFPVLPRVWPWAAALLLSWLAGAAWAQQEADPPARVAHLSLRQGSVVFAPRGRDEWIELPQNRPLTSGDRLWSDRGGRAELQLGTATLHLDGESHLGFGAVDRRTAHMLLQQGRLQARVRELMPGENFEVGTPHLAFRAVLPGEYRIAVDPHGGSTRVEVLSGAARVFGETGQSLQLEAGQQAAFAGRRLAPVQLPHVGQDGFGAWAAERNRREDQSIAARHLPRGVVGYAQLDPHGTWAQDPQLGAVWYPRVEAQDWAPYRHGHWEWIRPWGWTWIDAAPWGFAPFHYGRWTILNHRWAWVPGRLSARPVYAPALVVFLGGSNASLAIGTSPAVGWYPLAPGEAWWPAYRASPGYLNFANVDIDLNAAARHADHPVWRQRPYAITLMREDDFRRSRPVQHHWHPVQPHAAGQALVGVAPTRPDGGRERQVHGLPPMHVAPPAALQPPALRSWDGRAGPERDWRHRDPVPALREQYRAEREQQHLQWEAERDARRQQRQFEERRQQDDVRAQREQLMRQQQESARQQEQAQREGWQRHRGPDSGRRHRGDEDGRRAGPWGR